MARGNFLRTLRISLLLYLLAMVALGAWLAGERSTDWEDTLWVAIYPINGDDSDTAAAYIDTLEDEHFQEIERFIARETTRYEVSVDEPVRFQLGEPVADRPPVPPASGNVAAVIWWSLKMRWWAWQVQRAQDIPAPDVQMFVQYFDPADHERLAHSVGIRKGLYAIVNAFASRRDAGGNNVVIAHELLHTLGATDKYDLATGLPLHPDGYAEPDRSPLWPQTKAEIMGGRIPISGQEAQMPSNLTSVLVGAKTAGEIRWRE